MKFTIAIQCTIHLFGANKSTKNSSKKFQKLFENHFGAFHYFLGPNEYKEDLEKPKRCVICNSATYEITFFKFSKYLPFAEKRPSVCFLREINPKDFNLKSSNKKTISPPL